MSKNRKNKGNKKPSVFDLLKTVDSDEEKPEKKIEKNSLVEKQICDSLMTDYYQAEATIAIIEKIEPKYRLLYSEITNYIYSIKDKDRERISYNVQKLYDYVCETKDIKETVYDFAVRVYDNCQLAFSQINMLSVQSKSVEKIISPKIDEVKKTFREELKEIEKEYITILGIFSSVVLAFVGGISFSSSILEGIDKVSRYRLVFVIILLGFVLYNIIGMLLNYIWKITKSADSQKKFNIIIKNDMVKRIIKDEKEQPPINRKPINLALISLALAVFLVWGFQTNFFRSFFQNVKNTFCHNSTAITEEITTAQTTQPVEHTTIDSQQKK